MKFRTEITIEPFAEGQKIDHSRRGFSVGSCFAERIAERLRRAKIPVKSYSGGVLYNPISIADALSGDVLDPQFPPAADAEKLREADFVLVTFGTAWVYELDGRVVANCGRRPASIFTRKRLTVSEITARFDELLRPGGALHGRQIIFSLSPVRHLKDGLEENSLSKAILRVSIAEIVAKHADCQYFPAFEILLDDLRDYRFYGPDLAHPSAEGVEYVWERFSAAALAPSTLALLPEIEGFVRAAEHRPLDANSLEHSEFRASMRARIADFSKRHPWVDLSAEINFFS